MAPKAVQLFDRVKFNMGGLRAYVGYFTTNSTSNPLAAEMSAPGVTITREGVGQFHLALDVQPEQVVLAAAFLQVSATSSTESAKVFDWDIEGADVVYQSADGTAADSDDVIIGFLILTRSGSGVPS